MRTLFHIAHSTAWSKAQANGFYVHPSLAQEGFIHSSRPHQIIGTYNRYYANSMDLVLLVIDQDLVEVEIKYEGKDPDNLFPHFYGSLNTSSVVESFSIDPARKSPLPISLQVLGETLLRRAYGSDAGEIANVHLNSWKQSYRGLIPDSVLNELHLSFRRRMQWWSHCLKKPGHPGIFVAESRHSGLVGFASVGVPREKEFLEICQEMGELTALYLFQDFQGQGVGRALLTRALEHLKELGRKQAYAWVLRDNPTTRFYEKSGAKLSTQTKTVEIGAPLEEISYLWKL